MALKEKSATQESRGQQRREQGLGSLDWPIDMEKGLGPAERQTHGLWSNRVESSSYLLYDWVIFFIGHTRESLPHSPQLDLQRQQETWAISKPFNQPF